MNNDITKSLPKFRCPVCDEEITAAVVDSRPHNNEYLRYRECEECGTRFATVEKFSYIVRKNKSRKQ